MHPPHMSDQLIFLFLLVIKATRKAKAKFNNVITSANFLSDLCSHIWNWQENKLVMYSPSFAAVSNKVSYSSSSHSLQSSRLEAPIFCPPGGAVVSGSSSFSRRWIILYFLVFHQQRQDGGLHSCSSQADQQRRDGDSLLEQHQSDEANRSDTRRRAEQCG